MKRRMVLEQYNSFLRGYGLGWLPADIRDVIKTGFLAGFVCHANLLKEKEDDIIKEGREGTDPEILGKKIGEYEKSLLQECLGMVQEIEMKRRIPDVPIF